MNRYCPFIPLFVIARRLVKKIRKPIETLGFDKKSFRRRRKNPRRIKNIGKSKDKNPKYLESRLFISIKEFPLFEKDKRSKRPVRIRPKETIE